MATYNSGAVSNAAIAFQKPITLQQGRALRDNPEAVREGDASAPRIASKALNLGAFAIALANSPTVVSGFDGASNLFISCGANDSSPPTSDTDVSIEVSSDGVTWSSSQIIASTSAPSTVAVTSGTALLDLATGVLSYVSNEINGSWSSGVTGITAIRLARTGIGGGQAHGFMVGV